MDTTCATGQGKDTLQSLLLDGPHQIKSDLRLIRRAAKGMWNIWDSTKSIAAERLHQIIAGIDSEGNPYKYTHEQVLMAIRTAGLLDSYDLRWQIAKETGKHEFVRADVVNNITNITNQSQTNVLQASPGSLWGDIDRIKGELQQAQEAEQVDREIPQDIAYEREARRLAGLSQTSHAPVQLETLPVEQTIDTSALTENGFAMPDREDEPAPTGYEPYSSAIGWGHDHRPAPQEPVHIKPETPHLGNADGLPGQSNDDAGRAKRAIDPHRP